MNVQIFTSEAEDKLFQRTTLDAITTEKTTDSHVITLGEETYQTIDGFGASFTDSAAYLINQVLDEATRDGLMRQLFDEQEGIGLSVVRNPMGASDYARTIYSYCDEAGISNFSIDHDKADIIPLTQQAKALNPHLKLICSPWSAPAWMKTSQSMKGGSLLKEHYNDYAEYFVRFIEAYEAEGLSVYAITPQNEPLYEPKHYPSMLFLARDEADFVGNHLKPLFVQHRLNTKILGYDHNWDRLDYPLDLLDLQADAFDGIAWHWYGGRTVSQSRVKTFYPNHEIHFTEGSGGEWIPTFEPAFSNLMRTVIEILQHHAQSVVLWNMALDDENGPFVPGFGKSTCRGIVTVHQDDKTYTPTVDYFGLAHFSKFIRPGAVRLAATDSRPIRTVYFKNVDGSRAMVCFNDSDENHTVTIASSPEITLEMKAKSAYTIVWPA